MEKEELKLKLNDKLEQEISNFKEKLKEKTPDEILECAYELVSKEAIISELQEMNLDENELKALLKENDLLTECYTDWRNSDGRLGEVISYGLVDTIEVITSEYEKEKSIKSKECR